MLMPLGPLAAGAFGWFRPTDAWVGLLWTFLPVMHVAQALEDGDIPERARPRFIAWTIGYGVLCGVAAPLARGWR
jgi:hypothetical protein